MTAAGRHRVSVALLLAAGPPALLTAQVSIQPSIGLRYATPLVHDSIVTSFDVRPALAPALAVTATSRTAGPWAAQATLDFSTSTLERHDAGGATVDLGRLSTLALAVGVRRSLPAGLAAAARVGGLKYLPASETGIFREGAGGVLALASAALSYAPPGAVAGPWRFGVEARYDLHRFITPALRTEGFTSGRVVHRIALSLEASWGAP